MSEYKSNEERRLRHLFSPFALVRMSSILVAALTVGHMSAYPWASTRGLQEAQLIGSMKSLDLTFMGERATYWNLYFGWGLLVGVLLLTLAIILWLLSDLARLSPLRLGAITGIISAACSVGACLSFRFFYIPPFIIFSVICVILLTATAQLLKKQTNVTDGKV